VDNKDLRIEELSRELALRDKTVSELMVKISEFMAKMAELTATISAQTAKMATLEATIARLSRNSSTSSKPPSSDIVKPKKTGKKGRKGKRGAQAGHAKHERAPFPPEQIDDVFHYRLVRCPKCGTKLQPGRVAPRVLQQIELVEKPVRIEEHRGYPYWCPHCKEIHYAEIPIEVKKAGLVGKRLTALVAFMKGACHASFSTIRKFLRDVVGVTISRGYLRNLLNKAGDALESAFQELLAHLPTEAWLNIDETGHREEGSRFWTWCFRAELYTLFRIDKSRGSDVLIKTLGKEFEGVLGCDYFSAYRKYMGDFNVQVQFCLAHLIRDVKFLTTLTDKVTKTYGLRLLEGLRNLFRIIHVRGSMPEEKFQRKLQETRASIVKTAKNAPMRTEAQNIAERFRQHGEAYFQFITTPDIAPTNNLAEQAIRFVVMDRHITQGTRGAWGRQWSERIWTLIATCAQQGRSVYDFLCKSIDALFRGQPAPSLLPNST
jgi:transposase